MAKVEPSDFLSKRFFQPFAQAHDSTFDVEPGTEQSAQD